MHSPNMLSQMVLPGERAFISSTPGVIARVCLYLEVTVHVTLEVVGSLAGVGAVGIKAGES